MLHSRAQDAARFPSLISTPDTSLITFGLPLIFFRRLGRVIAWRAGLRIFAADTPRLRVPLFADPLFRVGRHRDTA